MRKLNGIVKGFNKLIAKLENLEEDNVREAAELCDEIKEKHLRVGELSAEATKAKNIRDKIVALIA